ncbi:hypothetical protein JCM30237_00160 [Halolamina litorea]|uniref:PGF-CTERM protein n=1 Tax=Halolamina litorea TaxID=1515593 RepID=A0ABD6BRG5_9EURY|nr:hypothetical protein [Halolamina litorea]
MRRTLTLLVVGCILLSGLTGAAIAQDREPNDSFEDAVTIEPGEHEGLTIESGDDEDYFAIDVAAGTSLRVTLTAEKRDGRLPESAPDLTIYRETQGSVDSTSDYDTVPSAATATMNASEQFDEAQTVYIRVDGDGNTEESTDYRLTLVTQDDRFEHNGDFEQAALVEPGSYEDLRIAGGHDQDYFAVDVAAGTSLRVTLTAEKRDGRLPESAPDLTIYRETQGSVDSTSDYDTVPSAATATMNASEQFDEAQTVYIRVEGDGNSPAITDYRLTLVTQDDQFEHNGGFDTAAGIEPGSYEDLRIAGGNDQDYFAVDVTAGATLNVTLVSEKRDGTLPRTAPSVDLYDPQQGRIGGTSNYETVPASSTASLALSEEFDEAQTVYIRVDGDTDASEITKYNLSVRLMEPAPTATSTPTSKPTPTPVNTAATSPPDRTARSTAVPTTEFRATDTDDRPGSTTTESPGFDVASTLVALVILFGVRRRG